jgi:hypothetical protein
LFIRTILICIDKVKIPIGKNTRVKYVRYFALMIMQSEREAPTIRESREASVIRFPEYLRRIKEKFGEASKQYLIAMICTKACVRSYCPYMSIIESLENANDTNKNYLVIIDSNTSYFIFSKHKTIKNMELYQLNCQTNLFCYHKIIQKK